MFKKWLKAVFKFVPPIFLVFIPATAIYGSIAPWDLSANALSKYPGQHSLLVGFSSVRSKNSWSQTNTYLVIGPGFTTSKTIEVSADSNGKLEVKESEGGLLQFIITYVILILITWFSWSGYRMVAHNQSLNSTPQSGAN